MKAVPSTTHGMIKFPVMRGTLTLRSSRIIPIECAMVSGPEDQPPPVNKVEEERIKVAINPEHTEQTVMIGSNLTERARTKLCDYSAVLWMQKKRGQAAERNIAINEEVSKLVTAGIMREVYYHDWLSNPVMVKKHDDSWRMCVDFKDLNKACPKDGYPLPEMRRLNPYADSPSNAFWTRTRGITKYKWQMKTKKKPRSSQTKAFLLHENAFRLKKRWSNLPKRLVDRAFHRSKWLESLKVYVNDLVIKSHTEDEVIRDIEETFITLRKINMNMNPKKCTFGVEEGMFLGDPSQQLRALRYDLDKCRRCA
ncbi:hypothetical protein Tco_0345485 [Tanacetum coccineum]